MRSPHAAIPAGDAVVEDWHTNSYELVGGDCDYFQSGEIRQQETDVEEPVTYPTIMH